MTSNRFVDILSKIDHTKLVFDLGEDQEAAVRTLCQEANEAGFAAVCVRPEHVFLARQCLGLNSLVKIATVIGFPKDRLSKADEADYPVVGNVNSTTKFQEICQALSEGADELDLVMNVSFFKADLASGGNFTAQELQACIDTAGGEAPIKWIIETDLLSEQEIIQATKLAAKLGVDMVKTCTGMITDGQGAQLKHIRLIRETLDSQGKQNIGIKASGGIRSLEDAKAFSAAGATRLGTSAGLKILEALKTFSS